MPPFLNREVASRFMAKRRDGVGVTMSGNDKDQVKNSNEFEANLFIKKIEALRSGSGSALGDFKINVPGHYPGPGRPSYPGKKHSAVL